MTQKQKTLIENLISLLPEEQKNIYDEIINCLVELGYVPQKQNVKDYIKQSILEQHNYFLSIT